MLNLKIYCTSIKYFNILDKLPAYIKPLGLGNYNYPEHWNTEKKGENIAHLNEYYGELTGLYWIWKNKLKDLKDTDWIGNCHYRKLWLNNFYDVKQKLSFKSLYSQLLKPENKIFLECDAIQVQPVFLKKETVYQQFDKVHKKDILKNCINFLKNDERENFIKYLNGNELCGLNMFITKVYLFKKYCESLFPWLELCLDYCIRNDLCKDYNTRLPAFLAERYTSYWFSTHGEKKYLSYARLGKVMLSNNINKIINPTKIPFTFRMYPTIHDY